VLARGSEGDGAPACAIVAAGSIHDELGDGLPRALAESGLAIVTAEAAQSNAAGQCVEVNDVAPLPIRGDVLGILIAGSKLSSTAARLPVR
jgi:hypothetical protein